LYSRYAPISAESDHAAGLKQRGAEKGVPHARGKVFCLAADAAFWPAFARFAVRRDARGDVVREEAPLVGGVGGVGDG
jgi:hypothetical protein